MPDTRSHRGPHPEDRGLFAPAALPVLRDTVDDLCWLVSRGYATPGALKLVGDRHQLAARQRMAVGRAACSNEARSARLQRRVDPADARGRPLALDGFNLLTTVEVALSGGLVLACRDETDRDIAGMHGTYRRVEETRPALVLIGQTLAELQTAQCCWFLDRPVSNSGRLRTLMLAVAAEHAWPWTVELAFSPDRAVCEASMVVVSADSAVLDRCGPWLNLAREVVARAPAAWRVAL